MEARRSRSGRAVRHRAARTARREPRRGAARNDAASGGPVAARAAERQRRGSARRLPGERRELESGHGVVPAAEWLLDNYHLVEEQIREIRDDLPPGYYRQLPKLAEGPFAGYPRVFGLAWAFVAHTDSHFDPEMLRRFFWPISGSSR